MKVFIMEWLVWYGQYLVCTKYLIIELNGWYAQNTSSIEWLLWYAQNTQNSSFIDTSKHYISR